MFDEGIRKPHPEIFGATRLDEPFIPAAEAHRYTRCLSEW